MITLFKPDMNYARDTGLVIVLALMITAIWMESLKLIWPAIVMLLIAMTIPSVFKPAAIFWHYFSLLLSSMTNRILLTILFMVILVPVGIVRRWFGFDPMKRKQWKQATCSVFVVRNHRFSSKDLTTPF